MDKKYFYWSAVVALTIYLSFDILAKVAFERISSHVLGTKISTSTVKTNIVAGKFQIKDLKVYSPGKFKEPYLFAGDEIDLTLSLRSLLTDTIKIDDLKVISGNITYELNPKLSLQDNIDTIKNNIKNYTNNDEPEKKIILHNLIINNCKFKYNLAEPKTHTISLPNIKIEKMGVKENGVYIKQAGW